MSGAGDNQAQENELNGEIEYAGIVRRAAGDLALCVRGWIAAAGGDVQVLQAGLPGQPLVIADCTPRPGESGAAFSVSFAYSEEAAVPRQIALVAQSGRGVFGLRLPLPRLAESSVAQECPPAVVNAAQRLAEVRYRAFIEGGEGLALSSSREPQLSIVYLGADAATLYGALRDLERLSLRSCEVLVPDRLHGEDQRLLGRMRGLRYYAHSPGSTLPGQLNLAAAAARGKYLLFLSPEVSPLQGALQRAQEVLEHCAEAGALTGRIIRPDGMLFDAGVMLRPDGVVDGFGYGRDASSWEYLYQREVDCSSAVFCFTRRELFLRAPFDEQIKTFFPALVDYCARLWERGSTVLYHPDVVVMLRTPSPVGDLTAETGALREVLERRPQCAARKEGLRDLRQARRLPAALIVIGELSADTLRAGRLARLTRFLCARRFSMTLYAARGISCQREVFRHELPDIVECCSGGCDALGAFLEQRSGCYDLIVVWQLPHLRRVLDSLRSASTRVVCDVAGREIFSDCERALLRKVSLVLVGGEEEERRLRSGGITHVTALPAGDRGEEHERFAAMLVPDCAL